MITAKGLQHVTPDELSALTAETPPTTEGESAKSPHSDDSLYELKLRQNDYESAFEVRRKDQARPNLTYQIEPGILRVAFSQKRPESEQVQDLTAMLNELMQELQATFSPSGLVIDIDYATYPSAAERLATHASQDVAYRALATRLRREDLSAPPLLQRYVRRILQVTSLTPELDQLVAAFAMRLQVSSVERCRAVPRHPEPDLTDWLHDRHLATNRSLPVSCNVTFALVPTQSNEPSSPTTRASTAAKRTAATTTSTSNDAGDDVTAQELQSDAGLAVQ